MELLVANIAKLAIELSKRKKCYEKQAEIIF